MLPTEPASSVAKTSIVFRPLVCIELAGSNGMLKLPRASVELFELGTGDRDRRD